MHSKKFWLTLSLADHAFQSTDGKLKSPVRSICEKEFSELLNLHNKSFNNTQFVFDDDGSC